jgi:hypothetical protein
MSEPGFGAINRLRKMGVLYLDILFNIKVHFNRLLKHIDPNLFNLLIAPNPGSDNLTYRARHT